MKMYRRAMASAVVVIALAGCSAAAPGATNTPAPTNAPTARATARPTTAPTVRPTPTPAPSWASHIVPQLDELARLAASGDGDATGAWANDEAEWVTANAAGLLDPQTGVEGYATNIVALLQAVVDGTDQTVAVATLVAMRNDLATAAGMAPVATPEPTQAATYPKSYATLSARNWARVVKAPDNYTGKGYKVWACITQFDAATGPGSFLAHASNQNQDYWYLNGDNASFSGDAGGLAPFVEGDIVAMDVMSMGSYSYDTQAGGNTTVPQFMVMKIVTKGSCE
jgi:hypothetical protein